MSTRAFLRGGAALVASSALLTSGLSGPASGLSSTASGAGGAASTLRDRTPEPSPTATGSGGAVSSVDAEASRVGLQVLRHGGNAADAAVAMASALGVTEPYSAGIGGGGFFVYHDAKTREVSTIDGRETAPAGIEQDAFIDPATGEPYPFTPDLVSSGVAVGVPGTPATWEAALRDHGTWSLRKALAPSILLAAKGFRVDETFRSQTLDNAERFAAFPDTADLFLPGGDAPAVGSRFRNPDLAKTLSRLALLGPKGFYRGPVARDVARTVQRPPVAPDADLPAPAGSMTNKDLAGYRVERQAPTHSEYRGMDVYGMAPSSSGGIAVGEALNVLEGFELGSGAGLARSLHLYLEASAIAFADRAAYVGDVPDVPVETLLSQDFADSRACTIDPEQASERPVQAGALDGPGGGAGPGAAKGAACETMQHEEKPDTENVSTTHLSVVDRWGNAASYTLTIEQTGGSGITVPGRGFLLNNELTDFTAEYDPQDPNRIEPGKRPRSSMAPTIVLEDGEVRFVVGSPGGATIITTVLQVLLNRLDLGMSLPEAVAAPRASQRNTATTPAEPGFIEAYGTLLEPFGQELEPSGDAFTSQAEIGAAAAIERDAKGRLTAVAEPERRGGGTAYVVKPRKR
ncbi:gamma-glutamyltransferase [Aeromicrobium sp. CF4.19]|uniref:gamma-glutamyltransferase n=1 Tax=Aeromicrobium sp. CF4.19 TaxID=3373082 RepID=UPI003EE7C2E1